MLLWQLHTVAKFNSVKVTLVKHQQQWPSTKLWPQLLARLFNPPPSSRICWHVTIRWEKHSGGRLSPHDIWWHGTICWEKTGATSLIPPAHPPPAMPLHSPPHGRPPDTLLALLLGQAAASFWKHSRVTNDNMSRRREGKYSPFKQRSCVFEAKTKLRKKHEICQVIVPLETTQHLLQRASLHT